MSNGRPSDYTDIVADTICHQLAKGLSLRKICEAELMPSARTVFRWLASNDSFRQQYDSAKQECADFYAEQIAEITDADPERDETGKIDPGWVSQQRLRVDARKWIACKLKPKKYGDRIQAEVEHTGAGGVMLVPAPMDLAAWQKMVESKTQSEGKVV